MCHANVTNVIAKSSVYYTVCQNSRRTYPVLADVRKIRLSSFQGSNFCESMLIFVSELDDMTSNIFFVNSCAFSL